MNLINHQYLHAKLLDKEAEKWKADHAQQVPSIEDYVKYTAQALVNQNTQMISDDMQKEINKCLLRKASHDKDLTITNTIADVFAGLEKYSIVDRVGLGVTEKSIYSALDLEKFVEAMKQINTTYNPIKSHATGIKEFMVYNALENELTNYFWENVKAVFEKAGYKVIYYCRDFNNHNNNRITVELN